jgi:truncated hemoglobin YjbI
MLLIESIYTKLLTHPDLLALHPIFPSDVFRRDIKKELCEYYGAIKSKKSDRDTGQKQEVISFRDNKEV